MDQKARERRLSQIRLAFANNTRTLRLRANMTQQELSDRAGVHRVTITRIESRVHHPLMAEACLIADALGVSIADMRNDLGQAVD